MQAKSCANRDAAHPYWKPRAKGFHPFGYPHHFLTNGTHIEKTAFYHVGPFLENATAHDIHFAEALQKSQPVPWGAEQKFRVCQHRKFPRHAAAAEKQ